MLSWQAKNSKFAVIVFFLTAVCIFGLTLPDRWITRDDAWFAEQSYWFAQKGFVKSELFRGVLDYQERQLVYHKLHVWQGALVYKLTQWSPYIFKAIPLAYLIALLWLARLYLSRILDYQDWQTFFLFSGLMLFNSLVVQHGYEFRPEIIMMCTGFISYLGLRRYLDKDAIWLAVLSGTFAGITALLHLNGLIFGTAGIVFLLVHRRYRALLPFGLAAAAVLSLYFVELLSPGAFELFLYQFTHDPALSDREFSLTGWLYKLILEPKRFLSHFYEASYTFLFIFVLVVFRKDIKHMPEIKNLLIYFIVLEVNLALISPGDKTMYLLYHMPYIVLIVTLLGRRLLIEKGAALKRGFVGLVGFFVVAQLGHTYSIYSKANGDIVELHERVAEKFDFDQETTITAPMTFIFNQINDVQIQGLYTYVIWEQKKDFEATFQNIADAARRFGRDFIVLEPENLEYLNMGKLDSGELLAGYRYLGSEDHLHVFQAVSAD